MSNKKTTEYSLSQLLTLYLPTIAGVLVFIGSLKTYLYYESFGIPIFSYVSLNELIIWILYLLQNLKWYIIFVFAGIFIWKFVKRLFPRITYFVKATSPTPTWFWPIMIFACGISIIFIALCLYWNAFYLISLKTLNWIMIFGISILGCALTKTLNGIFKELIIPAGIISFLTFYTFVVTRYELNNVKEKKTNNKVIIIKTDSTKISSNDSIYYIGSSEKYVFVYYERLDQSIIIPSDQIRQIVFPAPKKK